MLECLRTYAQILRKVSLFCEPVVSLSVFARFAGMCNADALCVNINGDLKKKNWSAYGASFEGVVPAVNAELRRFVLVIT